MQSLSICADWRAEIAAELQVAEATLTSQLSALEAAEAAQHAARMERARLHAAVDRLNATGLRIASALLDRAREYDRELSQAEAGVVTAKQGLTTARAHVGDLRDALSQLDLIDPPPVEAEEPEAVEA